MGYFKPVMIRTALGLAGMIFFIRVSAAPGKYTPDTLSRNPGIEIIKDGPIVGMLDSLSHYTFTGSPDYPSNRAALNVYGYAPDYVPAFPDSVLASRIRKMDDASTFEYVYNPHVKLFIDLYANRKRGLTERILGLAKIYFPLFEEQLDRFNLPLELKYLAVIESALNPVARSPVGAKGLWQFMYHTGKMYDLNVTTLVDDRNDPYKATIAACRHMQDLYCIYKDWSLVLAAYNAGAGNVNKAVRRAGGVLDYWVVQRYLPRETRDYVPAFIAASYVITHATEHNLYPVYPGITAAEIDSVAVKQMLTFEQLSEMFRIPMDNIRFLNPCYTKDIIPAGQGKVYYLRLPKPYIADFINNEAALYAFKTPRMAEKEKFFAQVNDMQDRSTVHVVRRGETLASIARKYHVSVTDLKRWNNIHGSTVKTSRELFVTAPGQRNKSIKKDSTSAESMMAKNAQQHGIPASDIATVPVDTFDYKAYYKELLAQGALKEKPAEIKKPGSTKSNVVYHTIRQGDTLWGIANQYEGVTVQQIKQWNNINNAKSLKPGQKIKITIGG